MCLPKNISFGSNHKERIQNEGHFSTKLARYFKSANIMKDAKRMVNHARLRRVNKNKNQNIMHVS
jgi:hypothetical protein